MATWQKGLEPVLRQHLRKRRETENLDKPGQEMKSSYHAIERVLIIVDFASEESRHVVGILVKQEAVFRFVQHAA